MIFKGDVYYADLNPIIGSEQGGVRPVVILQNDIGNKYSQTTIVAPMTTKSKTYVPMHVKLKESFLAKRSTLLLEQIRTIDKRRLIKALNSQSTRQDVELLLNNFFCSLDGDIEMFLRDKAISFEELSKARTYLVIDGEQVDNPDVQLKDLRILGYFALALKVLSIPDDYSNRKRKELDGLSAKLLGEVIKDIPCYLIGQLARNDEVSNKELTGKQLLEMAFSVIQTSVDAVGGRIVMIECRDRDNLVAFYQDNDFVAIAEQSDNGQPMKQMIRKIQ